MNITKKIIISLIAIFLILTIIQEHTRFIHIKRLGGYTITPPKIEFSFQKFISGKYQSELDYHLKHKLGFKEFYIRTYNEYIYDINKETRAMDVYCGKEGFLYGSFKTYFGQDYKGERHIDSVIARYKLLKDYLESRGKTLLTFITPYKQDIYPEYFPEEFETITPQTTNYEYFTKSFKSANIDFIDFNAYAKSIKDTVSFPIFTKHGVHWSYYMSYLGMDTIVSTLKKKGYKIPQHKISKKWTTTKPRGDEYDMGNLLNIARQLPTEERKQIMLEYLEPDTSAPNLIVVADSFWWQISNQGFPAYLFKNYEYWYYGNTIYDKDWQVKNIKDISLSQRVDDYDIFLFLFGPWTFTKFPFKIPAKLMSELEQDSISVF